MYLSLMYKLYLPFYKQFPTKHIFWVEVYTREMILKTFEYQYHFVKKHITVVNVTGFNGFYNICVKN